ncbi:S24 family peptidase [Rosenbergiella metrosideri]|uniref:S24 family peptidase n=1 Tax=Rosenbergiella metrosideri TaxID=2921185 RepID=UPI001F4F93C8|nr:S24 family peptidase [Rosenbergiella metrosideri]
MGFPSPAKDFEEQPLSLDQLCNTRAPSVYLMRYAQGSHREYIKPNSVLVVDSSVTPTSGSLIVATIDGEFVVRRYVLAGGAVRLEQLDEPTKGRISSDDSLFEGDWPQFFGVVTNTVTFS